MIPEGNFKLQKLKEEQQMYKYVGNYNKLFFSSEFLKMFDN